MACALDCAALDSTGTLAAIELAAIDAFVCKVLAGGGLAIDPSWNCGTGAAFMGNEPAGQLHRQAQPPFFAACSASARLPVACAFPPAPAMTVTAAAPLAAVFEEALDPPFASVVALAADPPPATTVTADPFVAVEVAFDALPSALTVVFVEPEPATTVTAVPFAAADVAFDALPSALTEVAAEPEPEPEPATIVTAAAPFAIEVAAAALLFTVVQAFAALPSIFAEALDPLPPPATTVTGPACVPDTAAALAELLLPPDPAWIVMAARAEPALEATAELLTDVELLPDSASTVTADGLATVLLAFNIPFPDRDSSAWTIATLLTADARDESVSAAAFASSFDRPPAETVTAAFVPFTLAEDFSRRIEEVGPASALALSSADFCLSISSRSYRYTVTIRPYRSICPGHSNL
jgi:hypothetical protein